MKTSKMTLETLKVNSFITRNRDQEEVNAARLFGGLAPDHTSIRCALTTCCEVEMA